MVKSSKCEVLPEWGPRKLQSRPETAGRGEGESTGEREEGGEREEWGQREGERSGESEREQVPRLQPRKT